MVKKMLYQYLMNDTASGEMCIFSNFEQVKAHKALCDKLLEIDLQAHKEGDGGIFRTLPESPDALYGMALSEIDKIMWDIFLYDLSSEIDLHSIYPIIY